MKRIILLTLFCFPLLAIAQDDPCSKLTTKVDDLRGITTISTEYTPEISYQLWLTKSTQDGKKPVYMVHARLFSATSKRMDGFFLLLENGKRIARPNAHISVDVDPEKQSTLHPGYIYEGAITLTPQEIFMLKASPITKYGIAFIDERNADGDNVYRQFKCIFNLK